MTQLSHHPTAAEQTAGCPIDHQAFSRQKTMPAPEAATPAIACDAQGVWHVRGFHEARLLLRHAATKQAGFNAEMIGSIPGMHNVPILYQEGKVHQQQRKQTARFFTPKVVSEDYRQLMEALADQMVARLRRAKRADLSLLSRRLAVRVAGEVVGLTNSRLPGMERRLDAFFTGASSSAQTKFGWRPDVLVRFVSKQSPMALFFLLDVRPAIHARRKHPKEDVISHLLAQNYGETEILTECVTYGAAGMVTTREFICVAAWHLLENADLRAIYLAGDEEARYQLLHEILRLEPVVGEIFRRATAAITLVSGGQAVTIPAGALIVLHLHGTNTDAQVVGDQAHQVCPARPLRQEGVSSALMSFGDGAHRCPGAYIAIQETDIFLRKLLALPNLRMRQTPRLSWNDLVTGYEIRDFLVALD